MIDAEAWRVLLFLAATGVLYDALVRDKKTGSSLTLLPCPAMICHAKHNQTMRVNHSMKALNVQTHA